MADTLMTPAALTRSNLLTCRLCDLQGVDADETFLYIYPSQNYINELNGDGELIEVRDYASDCSCVDTSRGEIATDSRTIVFYRKST